MAERAAVPRSAMDQISQRLCAMGRTHSRSTTEVADMDTSARAYRSRLDMINQYMHHSELPRGGISVASN